MQCALVVFSKFFLFLFCCCCCFWNDKSTCWYFLYRFTLMTHDLTRIMFHFILFSIHLVSKSETIRYDFAQFLKCAFTFREKPSFCLVFVDVHAASVEIHLPNTQKHQQIYKTAPSYRWINTLHFFYHRKKKKSTVKTVFFLWFCKFNQFFEWKESHSTAQFK